MTKKRRRPLGAAALEARDAQRDLGAELLLAIRQVKADLASRQAGLICLSLADQECFANALLSPPKLAPALERAFAHLQEINDHSR